MKDRKKVFFTVNELTRISILAVMSTIIMLVSTPLPFAPEFLRLDVSEVPIIIGTSMMGTMAGVFILLIKDLLQLQFSTTGGMGELFNFMVGCCYIIPFGLCYSKMKNKKGFVISTIVGSTFMVILACILNYILFIPAYASLYGMSIEEYVSIFSAINPNIDSLWTLILYTISIFNIIKATLISVISYLVYIKIKIN